MLRKTFVNLLVVFLGFSFLIAGTNAEKLAERWAQQTYFIEDDDELMEKVKKELAKKPAVALPAPSLPPVREPEPEPLRPQYLTQLFEEPWVGDPPAPPGWTQTRVVRVGDGIPEPPTTAGEKDWQRIVWNATLSRWDFEDGTPIPVISPTPTGPPPSGTGALFMNDFYWSTIFLGSRRLESPVINLAGSTSPYVRFFLFCGTSSTVQDLKVVASSDGGTTWHIIMVIPPNAGIPGSMTATTPWQRINVLIPPAFRVANAKIGLEFVCRYMFNYFIDNLTVEEFTPTTITSAASGVWSSSATWVGGVVPTADNHVVIAAGHTVNVDVAIARMQNLTVFGTFNFVTTPAVVPSIHIFGDLTVMSGGLYQNHQAGTTTGRWTWLGGSLSNAGTIDFSVGTTGNVLWFCGGAPATFTNTGTITLDRINQVYFANSGGVTIASPLTIALPVSGASILYLVNGPVNPAGNLTIGSSAVATSQIIQRGVGWFTAAPTWGAGVTFGVTYAQFFAQPQAPVIRLTGHEIQEIGGVRNVTGTLAMICHDNVQLTYPLTVGTATTGGLTLSRGILITSPENLLTVSPFVAPPLGALPSTAIPPLTHGSYIAGPMRINFPASNVARNFPLGVGTAFNGPVPNANVRKPLVLPAPGVVWPAGLALIASIQPKPSGTAISPLTAVMGTRSYRLERVPGSPDLPATATLTMYANNYTWGGGAGSDSLGGTIAGLRIAQSTSLTGPWTARSVSSGTETPIIDNTDYIRTTATAAPGPIAPLGTNGEFFAWGSTSPANDVGVSAFSTFPFTAVQNAPHTIMITIRNYGVIPQTNIPVFYTVAPFTDTVWATWTGTLPVAGSVSYSFPTPWTPTAPGAPLLSCGTGLPGDAVPANDVMTEAIPVFITGTRVGQLFNSVTFPPPGWASTILLGTMNWARATTSSFPPGYLPLEGSGMAFYNCFSAPPPASARLLSHRFNVGPTPQDIIVDFWMLNTNAYDFPDSLFLEYSLDSLTWIRAAAWRAFDAANPGWNKKTINLGDFPANQNMWIGFRAWSGYYHNIFIDSVRVWATPPILNDVGITDFWTTPYTAAVGEPQTVTVRIRNYGLNTQTSIPVYYTTPDGTVNETWTGSLPRGSSTNYTFTTPWTPSIDGAVSVTCGTNLPGDENPENNALTQPIQVFIAGTRVGQLFNAVTFPPPGWLNEIVSGPTLRPWERATASSFPSGYLPLEGAGMARYACYLALAGSQARLWTHKFNVGPNPQDILVNFWMLNTNAYIAYFDSLYLEYSLDSLTWTTVGGWRAQDSANPGWNKKIDTLGTFLENTNIWIGFRAKSAWWHDIYIDSVRAFIAPPSVAINDVGIDLITLPPPPRFVGTPYPVTVRIRNYGLRPMTSIPVSYDPGDGSPVVNETWTGSLPPGGSVLYTFTQPYTPTTPGEYTFEAYTSLPGDQNLDNDGAEILFVACPTFHTPDYTKDFDEEWENSTNPPFCGWVIKDGGSVPLAIAKTGEHKKPARSLTLSQDDNDWHRYDSPDPERTVAQVSYWPIEVSDDTLISPRLNCSYPGYYTLKFWHWYEDFLQGPPWNADTGAVLISIDGGTSWTLLDFFANVDDSGYKSYDITGLVAGQSDVRVMFRYKAYDELWWQIDDFEVIFAPLAPALISPPDDTLINDNTPLFDWSDVTGAVSYHIQVDNNDNFLSPEFEAYPSLSEAEPTVSLPDGHYYWRVRGRGQTAFGPWSGVREFDLDATPPLAPALRSPANNAEIDTLRPTFRWGKVTFFTAKKSSEGEMLSLDVDDQGITYRLMVDDEPTFASPIRINITTSDTFYLVPSPTPLSEDTFYWRVQATDLAGNVGPWSEVFSFRITLLPSLPIGWSKMPDVSGATKAVKGGGALTAIGRKVYALVGNNTNDFMEYSIDERKWTKKGEVPLGAKKKKVKKGAALTNDGQFVYVFKGGNTQEFYRYNPVKDSWKEMPPPGFTKGIKGGSMAFDGDSFIYAIRGSNDTEWKKFNIYTETWSPATPATLPEKMKFGSWLVYVPSTPPKMYCLRVGGKVNEFYRWTAGTWTKTTEMPLVGSTNKKKKAKGGSAGVYVPITRRIYAMKGGNTLEFFSLNPANDSWKIEPDVGKPATPAKRVKDGGALAFSPFRGGVFAFIGNNTNECWFYNPPPPSLLSAPPSTGDGIQGAFTDLKDFTLNIMPNPTKNEAYIYYTLPVRLTASLKLYNIAGEVVYSAKSDKGLFVIDSKRLPAGIYILRFKANEFEATRKLIITR